MTIFSSSHQFVEVYMDGLNGIDDESEEEEYVPSSMDKSRWDLF